jgi:hypothetical protein
MQFEVTDHTREEDDAFVIAQTREYNSAFTEKDAQSLCVFVRDESGSIVGGLTAKALWGISTSRSYGSEQCIVAKT